MQGDDHVDPSMEACVASLQHPIGASMAFIEVDLDGAHHVNTVPCEQRDPRLMIPVKPAAPAMTTMAATMVPPPQCGRKSSDSQDFEFNMLDLAAEMVGTACNVSPADELFYKGQLLPLQLDTRLQYMHQRRLEQASMEGGTRREEQEEEEGDDDPEGHGYDGLLFSSPCSDIRDLHSNVKFSSCRMDQQAAIDASSLLDFRCASFPSQASFFWDAGPAAGTSPFPSRESSYWDSSTAGGDSNCSSSRDSNGSSQDACYNPPCANNNSACGRMYHHHHHCARGRSPSASSASALKFWWKSFFVGLKKSSRVWVDQELNHSLNPSCNPDCVARRPTLSKNASAPTTLVGHQGLRRPLSSTDLASMGNLTTRSEKDRQTRPAWARWQSYARKLKLPLPTKSSSNTANPKVEKLLPEGLGRQGDHALVDASHAKGMLGSHGRFRRLPLERHSSQSSLLCDVKVGSCSAMPSSKKSSPMVWFKNYGSNAVASCPASVLSSPSHMLSPSAVSINGSNNSMSTMQELHSAVQGAIAHCKQSIAGHSTIPC